MRNEEISYKPKEIGFDKKDTISKGTNKNPSSRAVPLGKKRFIKWSLWASAPTIFVPIKTVRAKVKVNIIWLVTVKLYGINPIKFDSNTKKKIIK